MPYANIDAKRRNDFRRSAMRKSANPRMLRPGRGDNAFITCWEVHMADRHTVAVITLNGDHYDQYSIRTNGSDDPGQEAFHAAVRQLYAQYKAGALDPGVYVVKVPGDDELTARLEVDDNAS